MREKMLKIADRLDKRAEAIFNNLFSEHERKMEKQRQENIHQIPGQKPIPWPKSQMAGALRIVAEEIRETLEVIEYRKYEGGGDLFTIKEFEENVDSGLFIDSDGSGWYAKKIKGDGGNTRMVESSLPARPSRIGGGDVNYEYTHVAWYNK